MKRAFTTREKVMLLVLTVLLIVIAYFKLILEPINNSIDEYQEAMNVLNGINEHTAQWYYYSAIANSGLGNMH